MSKNIIEGIQWEMNRCRECVKVYDEIGPVGTFAKAGINADIAEGEAAIASGDVVRMLRAYEALKECE